MKSKQYFLCCVLAFLVILTNPSLFTYNFQNSENFRSNSNNFTQINNHARITQETSKIESLCDKNSPSGALPDFELEKSDGYYYPGFTIFNMEVGKTYQQIIMDENGNYETLPGTSWEPTLINSTTLLYHGWSVSYLYNLYTHEIEMIPAGGHHEVEYNPLNDTFFGFLPDKHTIEGEEYRFDILQEFNRKGEVVWELDLYDFIPLSHYRTDLMQVDGNGVYDVVHPNSIIFDSEELSLYINCRNLDTCYKINYTTKEVIWSLGWHGNITYYDMEGQRSYIPFFHAHALELIEDNHFILFDNDVYNISYNTRPYTRILEFTVDESTMTAHETWEWVGPLEYYTNFYGDADRLPNGNRLGTFGTTPYSSYSSRLTEVNQTKDIVWEVRFHEGKIYRAERFRYSPIIQPLIENFTKISNHYGKKKYSFTWQTWYNFRQKFDVQGAYYLFLDGNLIAHNNHTFKRWWQASNVSIELDNLEPGNHSLLLKLGDEAGHYTENTLEFIIKEPELQVETTFSNKIELNSVQNLTWYYDYYLVNCSILVNNSQILDFHFDDSQINLNITQWEIGNYNITLYFEDQIHNNTFQREFPISIVPQQPPQIFPLYENQSVPQFKKNILQWKIFDLSPESWTLMINEEIITQKKWADSNFTVSFDFSYLDIGKNTIKFFVLDKLGQYAENFFQIEVFPSNLPGIYQTEDNFFVQWGKEDISLKWSVKNAINWTMWRNGLFFTTGKVINNEVVFPIEEWQVNDWNLRTYEMKLEIANEENEKDSFAFNLTIFYDLGDRYANEYIKTNSWLFYDGENAVGAPDGEYATIVFDYSSGYLTLDMGELEHIINEEGDDFEVISSEGEYIIFVGNDLGRPFTNIGIGKGNQTFDLEVLGLSKVRYVQIRFFKGEKVELDAIQAIHYETHPEDKTPPKINHLSNFALYSDNSTTYLEWVIDETNPWNYSITINSEKIEEGSWIERKLGFMFNYSEPIVYTIILEVSDVLGNKARDEVKIIIINMNETQRSLTISAFIGIIPFSIISGLYLFLRNNQFKNGFSSDKE